MNEPNLNLDISNYLDEKEKGQTRLIRISGRLYYSRRIFNQQTGAPMPDLIPIDESAITKAIEQNTKTAETLAVLAADAKTAKEV